MSKKKKQVKFPIVRWYRLRSPTGTAAAAADAVAPVAAGHSRDTD